MNTRLLAALLVLPTALAGQKLPKRPSLSGGDTNDANAYARLGHELLTRDAATAADAFYWATRIDPSMADAHYGRWAAVLMSNPRRLYGYYTGQKNALQSDEMQRNDSSLSRALQLEPRLIRRYERELFSAYIKAAIDQGGGTPLTLEDEYNIDSWLDQYLRSNNDALYLRAQYSEAKGDNAAALKYYASATKSTQKKAGIRAARGRLFLRLGELDSAVSELTQALDELRKRDKKDFIVVYNSKANLELALGVAYQSMPDREKAKAAYGRALEEDLAYYPAHVALGYLALDVKDSTTALTEMELAAQLRADDGAVLQRYGYALYLHGKYAEAAQQFEKAAKVEPYFALPLRNLGEVQEKLGKKDEAVKAYRAFLKTAADVDATRATVTARLASLQP